MRKIYFLLGIFVLFFVNTSFSGEVSVSIAKKTAVNYYNHWSHYRTPAKIIEIIPITENNTLVYYVFNFSTGGYMIISADDEITPILSYSFKGHFIQNDPNMPPNYQYFLNNYKKQILEVKTRNLKGDKTVKEKWQDYAANIFKSTRQIQDVSPLLDIEGIAWDQGCYYNADCPADANGSCGHVYTGCVATAMGQIMRFYKWPDHGTGSHSYNAGSYGTLSADFASSNYDWSSMPASVTSANAEVAQILSHCGIAVEMSYSTSGSGAYVQGYVKEAFVNYFNYDAGALYAYRDNYTDANWKNLMYGDLDNGWPIFYTGTDQGGSSGHAFVCDGYQGTDQFHFNWGWSGYYNSYNTIDDLIPGGTGSGGGNGDFSYNQEAVFHIHPVVVNGLTAAFSGTPTSLYIGNSVAFTDGSYGNPTSWSWTFGDGGTATTQNPSHTYNTAGTYTVELTVSDGTNSDTETKTNYIIVSNGPIGSWIEEASGFATASRGISYISIADANTVWATAYDGSGGTANVQEFTKTTNGGTTWVPGTINIGNTALGIAMIDAIDANTAWIAAYPNGSGQTGGIWKTTNGGSTWTRQSTATYNNASSFTNVVHFWDANNGFCQGDPINGEFELYTTTNGGTTWTAVPGANIPNPLTGESGYTSQIEVVGDNVWFSTNKGRLYYSSDRGHHFTVHQTPLSDFGGQTQSGNFSFKDANNGLIVDNNAAIYKSTNGGANWTQVTPVGTVFTSGLCWVEGTDLIFSTGAAQGSSGSSYSEDGGTTWINIDSEQHLYVEFLDSQTGWSGWFNTDATTKGMWKWNSTTTENPIVNNSENKLFVYPNPMAKYLNLRFNDTPKEVKIQITNLLGKTVFSKTINHPLKNEISLNLGQVSKGLYILTVNNAGTITQTKIVKQ